MKIAQTIPTSAEVANATNAGEPITASLPKHPVSQALMRLADAVTGEGDRARAGGASGDAEGKAGRGTPPKRGILRRGGK